MMVAEAEIFDNLALQKHQQIEDYHRKVLEKGTKLKKTDRDIISRFVNGLPSQLAFFVRARNITNLTDALTSAKLGEAYGYRHDDSGFAVTRRTIRDETPEKTKDREQYVSVLEKNNDKLTARIRALEAKSRPFAHDRRKTDINTSIYGYFNCSGDLQ